jgi:hypothetical protein
VPAKVLIWAGNRPASLAGGSCIGSVGYLTHRDKADESVERLEVVAIVQNPPNFRFGVRFGHANVPVAPALE